MATVNGRFVYGWAVTTSNRDLPFDRGGNKDAVLAVGDYLAEEFATEVARAMNAADSGQDYTCDWDPATLKFTIDNGATAFALEFSRNASTNAAGLLGFADSDTSSSADGHTSTDTVGNESSNTYFLTAGVRLWDPSEPIAVLSPVVAAAEGSTASKMERSIKAVQNRADGGFRETIYFSTDKRLRMQLKWLSSAEATKAEALIDWIERGRRINYYPDRTDTANALRLVLENPGEIIPTFSALTRPELDYAELVFVESLSRV